MSTNTPVHLLSFLPAIYRDDEFLGRFLHGFEDVFADLGSKIDGIGAIFDPATTPDDFLPWLSSWVAFTLRADLDEGQRRAFLARIVPLYARRGTLQNLQDLLGIFTRGLSKIEESATQPHFFRVTMSLPHVAPDELAAQSSIAHALIELEKPAHTDYELDLVFPSMQIGVNSTVGVDTLLGTGNP